MIRVEPDDPRRCQEVYKFGQCPYKAMEGTQKCEMHSSYRVLQAANDEKVRNYQLQRFQRRVNNFADNPVVKSLREEIGITRMLLEEILNKCETAEDLMMFTNKINDLVARIEKLVVSCHKMEQSSGQLLDKSAVINFSVQIVDIITNHVQDGALIETISNEIFQRLENARPLQAVS